MQTKRVRVEDLMKDLGKSDSYFQEDEPGTSERNDVKSKCFRFEIQELQKPFKLYNISNRTEVLLEVQKKVDGVLTKNATKHSSDFVDGMVLIKGVQTDLDSAKKDTRQS